MTSNKKGGLGRQGFFQPTGTGAPAEDPAKPKKVRTTITLYPNTLSAMEQLKVELRKSGDKVTLSDVLEEAVWALMEKRGLQA